MSRVIKDSKEKVVFKKAPAWVASFSVAIAVMVIIAIIFVTSNMGSTISTPTASARHNLSFQVFYLDNEMFSENPISPHKDFLISYTDYIQVHNGLTVNFSEETNVQYTYNVTKRLVVRPLGSDRIVFEDVFVLSDSSGQVRTNRMTIGSLGSNGSNGTTVEVNGSYILEPKIHIETYRAFIRDQAQQMYNENVIAQGLSGFTADLLIDFTYTIYAPDLGINERLTSGYRMPLTTEIYSLSTTGVSSFEAVSEDSGLSISLPVAIIFVLTFGALVLGLLYFIREMKNVTSHLPTEAERILRKYDREIVHYNNSIDISRYNLMEPQSFDELLKLSINLSKQIMCYKGENYVEFVVIFDDFASKLVLV